LARAGFSARAKYFNFNFKGPRMKSCSQLLTWLNRVGPVALALVIAATPLPALATLGGDASTIDADRIQLQADVTQATASAHDAPAMAASSKAVLQAAPSLLPKGVSVKALRQPDGTVIQEYLVNGHVFKITWNGPTPPDLYQLIGSSYFPAYAIGVQASNQHFGRGSVHFRSPQW
jgi:hypothetical protein